MTYEEYMEWLRNRETGASGRYQAKELPYGGIAGARPTCCQPGRNGGVSLEEMDEEERRMEMARENWRLQMEMNGCGPDGNPLPREKKLEMMGYGPDGNPLSKEKKRSKYGNRRVEVDGKKFDSEHEARVYEELMLRVRAGELRCVMRQVPFDLPGGIRYFADFVTVGADLRVTVLDAKSEATRKNRVYINKKKQMLACNGIEVVEV